MMLMHPLEVNVAGPNYMGRDRNTGNVAVTLNECTNVYPEWDHQTKCHNPVGLWENLLHLP